MKLSLLIINDNNKLIINGKTMTSANIVKLEDQIRDGEQKLMVTVEFLYSNERMQ